MTPVERTLLIEIGRAVSTRILDPAMYRRLVAAINDAEREKQIDAAPAPPREEGA
jgi:hypothetical protein